MGCKSSKNLKPHHAYADDGATGSPSLNSTSPPAVLERAAKDNELREHLCIRHTPQAIELTMSAATLFLIKANHAKQVVQERKKRGCGSMVAALPSPLAMERHAEEVRKHMSRESKINDGLKLLMQRAEFIQVKVIHMQDDGNCQFRSLSHELFGDQHHHTYIRHRVVTYLSDHATDFSFYIGDDNEWAQYLHRMKESRTWGDELTLRAACEVFNIIVHVVTTERENWLLNYAPSSYDEGKSTEGRTPTPTQSPTQTTPTTTQSPTQTTPTPTPTQTQTPTPTTAIRECFLAYVSPIHYNVITLLTDTNHTASTTGY